MYKIHVELLIFKKNNLLICKLTNENFDHPCINKMNNG